MRKMSMQKMANSSGNKASDKDRNIRRRHTRIHLDSLRPAPPNHLTDTLTRCPKCQGLVLKEGGETFDETVIRCLNCGWQPHYQAPMIQETAESKTIRSLTAQFVAAHDWHRVAVAF
jgi:hypothetical protein